jgi:preprotein translocase subunit YajC
MNKTFKIFFSIIIISIVLLFVFIRSNRQEQNVCAVCNNEIPDGNKILQYGEVLGDIKLFDRFGKKFDLNEYKNKPVLMIFGTFSKETIFNKINEINVKLDEFIRRGLDIIYISRKIATDSIINAIHENWDKMKVYFDTDTLTFFKTFKIEKCLGSAILLNKKKKVLLSTLIPITIDQLFNVIYFKGNEIF